MAYPPAPAAQPPMQKQGNGFGVTALVLGIVGLVLGLIPLAGLFLGIPLGVLALIFGIIGLATSGNRAGKGKGTGGTGLVLGILAIAVPIAMSVFIYNEVADELDERCSEELYADTQECADWNEKRDN